MARTNNLTNFLTDVANAIKNKKGDTTDIPASEFDTEIINLPSQGIYQSKQMNITTNGNYEITPDTGYDAMERLRLNVNISGGSEDNYPVVHTFDELDGLDNIYTFAVMLNNDNSFKTAFMKVNDEWEDIREYTIKNDWSIRRVTGQNTFNYCNIFSREGMYKYCINVTDQILAYHTFGNSTYPTVTSTSRYKFGKFG